MTEEEKWARPSVIAKWLKEEKFWRDVMVNLVAGTILSIGIYVLGLIVGWFKLPDVMGLFRAILPGLLMVGLATASASNVQAGLRRSKRKDKLGTFVTFGYATACAALFVLWIVVLARGLYG